MSRRPPSAEEAARLDRQVGPLILGTGTELILKACYSRGMRISSVHVDVQARQITVYPSSGDQSDAAAAISLVCTRGTILFHREAPLDGPRRAWFRGELAAPTGLSVGARIMVPTGDQEQA